MGGPYYGRWGVNDVLERRLDSDWPSASDATSTTGAVLIPPSRIDWSGTSVNWNPNGSLSFTAVTYIGLQIFTSAYDNYLIDCRLVSNQASGNGVYYYLYTSYGGTAASGFQYQELMANSTTVSGFRSSSGLTYAYCSVPQNVQRSGFELYCYGPNLAQPTAFRAVSVGDASSATLYDVAATESSSTAYTTIGFASYAGNMTGQLSVYGLGG